MSATQSPPKPQDLAAELSSLRPVLYRFALRAVRDAQVAADLTQEALAAGLSRLSAFDHRSTLRTWAIGILSHKVMEHHRQAFRRDDREAAEADLLAWPSAHDVERVVRARQELAVVDRALGELPERERLAVLMVDVEGVERAEVCSVLAVEPTHLRVLLHRARNRLRRQLESD